MIEAILTDEQKAFRQMLRELGRREIEPNLEKYAASVNHQRIWDRSSTWRRL